MEKRPSKVISGGQSGADQAALWAAHDLGILTGGTAPRGWLTERGPAPELGELFGLSEHTVAGYPSRTLQNVLDSDGTLVFGNRTSPGCRLTRKYAEARDKPLLFVDWRSGEPVPSDAEVQRAADWLNECRISVLNVAGNRESKQPGITVAVYRFLFRVFEKARRVA